MRLKGIAKWILICLLVNFLFISCSHFSSQQPSGKLQAAAEAWWLDGKWPYEKSGLPRHYNAEYGRLSNGFRYIIQQNRRPRGRVSMYLVVQAGSLMEKDNELGVAHFLEHMAFNGSRQFPPGKLILFFQENGMAFGRDANAHTSLTETVYKLDLTNTRPDNIQKALMFFRDVADGLDISPIEVEKERGVILSEKAARESMAYKGQRRMIERLYPGTRFVNQTIGTEKIIRTVTAETIRDFYDSWYRPELMYLAVAGDVKGNPGLAKQIEKAFSNFKAPRPARRMAPWGDVHLSGETAFYDPYDAEAVSINIMAHHPREWKDDSLEVQADQVVNALAGSIVTKRLRRLRAEGKAPILWRSAVTRLVLDSSPYP